jgi:hypothetical protein
MSEKWQPEPETDSLAGGERVVREREQEEREREYLDPESNEAHGTGQICARCGAVITASQDARLGAGGWVHEECPVPPGGP